MVLTFGPLMCLTLLSFNAAIVLMALVSVPLTIVAVLPLPFVTVMGTRLGRLTFSVSWIVQARTADIATTVEENLSGVRVVKAFAAERAQIRSLAENARLLKWIQLVQAAVQAIATVAGVELTTAASATMRASATAARSRMSGVRILRCILLCVLRHGSAGEQCYGANVGRHRIP